MRKILLASHACLAGGMKSSVEMVTGPQEHLSAVCAYTEETLDFKGYMEIGNPGFKGGGRVGPCDGCAGRQRE